MPNIEIKAKYRDLEKAKQIARNLDAKHVGVDHQVDTYFRTPTGRLKLRESTLSGAQLVPYMRPDQAGPKKSDYLVIPVSDPENCKKLFDQILGIEAVVDKTRDIFLIDNVRVHLDIVKNLGIFFEFEAVYNNAALEKQEYAKVEKLMGLFNIPSEDLLTGSYREMVLNRS
jgi:adenylate cyclase class 2